MLNNYIIHIHVFAMLLNTSIQVFKYKYCVVSPHQMDLVQ